MMLNFAYLIAISVSVHGPYSRGTILFTYTLKQIWLRRGSEMVMRCYRYVRGVSDLSPQLNTTTLSACFYEKQNQLPRNWIFFHPGFIWMLHILNKPPGAAIFCFFSLILLRQKRDEVFICRWEKTTCLRQKSRLLKAGSRVSEARQ